MMETTREPSSFHPGEKSIRLAFPELAEMLGVNLNDAKQMLGGSNKSRERFLSPERVREILEAQGFQFPKKNIVFHCLKGGAAKTTLAYNTAFRLRQLGARVLVVDLDKQGNATHSLLGKKPKHVFVDVVTGETAIDLAIVSVAEGLDILPSSLDNARLDMELINQKKNPRTFYRNIFQPVRNRYDIVILDLPPDLSHNTYLSSLFADTICIPTNPDEYSVYGTRLTLASIEGIQREYEDLDQDVWVVWTKYDPREKQSHHYITDFKDSGIARVLPAVIRSDVSFKHAQQRNLSVFELTKRSNAKEDLQFLVRELIGLGSYLTERGNC